MQPKKPERITIRKSPYPTGRYVIKIEGKITWEGKSPHKKMPVLLDENKGKKISISWRPNGESLIV